MLITFGNTKLPKTTAVFNMSPALTCASDSLGLCEHSQICYAKKAEKMYKQVLPHRHKQSQFWLNHSALEFSEMFNEIYQRKRIKPKLLRLNESGDFFTQSCVDKAEKIATILRRYPVFTYTYTARTDLSFDGCKNLVINGSGFMPLSKGKFYGNMFKIVDQFSGRNKKCKANCNICNLCTVNRNYTIEAIKH